MTSLLLAGVLLLARLKPFTSLLSTTAEQTLLDTLAWRIMALAFVFHSLMLIAGAVWAQDAWGRYWSWSTLETWALLTWLMLGFSIHMRLTLRPSPAISSTLVILVFVMGFLTFFGLPFISTAPHKGMV